MIIFTDVLLPMVSCVRNVPQFGTARPLTRRVQSSLLLPIATLGIAFGTQSVWAAATVARGPEIVATARTVNVDHSQDTGQKLPDYSKQPPFSPNKFLDRLLDLINETHGAITARAFERKFEIKWTGDPLLHIGGNYEGGVSWYFEASIMENNEIAPPGKYGPKAPYVSLSIDFPSYGFGDWTKGECLLAGSTTKNLLASGWKLQDKRVYALTADLLADQFVRGNSRISLFHYQYFVGPAAEQTDDASCVTRFAIYTTF
jgi:hypothetical protein